MVLSICYGLAPNYYLALIIRTLWGFTNGNLGVLKTYVSEMCSEDKHSLGFSILVTMGGISKYTHSWTINCSVVGPSLGGFLGDAETYFPSLVRSYPWIRNVHLYSFFHLVSSISPMFDWKHFISFHSHHGGICIKGESYSGYDQSKCRRTKEVS